MNPLVIFAALATATVVMGWAVIIEEIINHKSHKQNEDEQDI